MRRIIAFVIAALMPLPACAAPKTSALYEVQVLVFANHLRRLDGGEHWHQDPNPRIRGLHHALQPSHELPPGSVLLAAENRLANHSRYTILAARSWIQDAVSRHKTRPVLIRSLGHGRLDGVIRVFQWRLLHVSLDLRYHHGGSLGGQGEVSGGSEPVPGESGSPFETTPSSPPVFRLIENRPVALNSVNYFDNPKFGVLVLVTRYKGQDPSRLP